MKRIADLSVFVSVVKAGSLSEASNDLGLSVASISKYISRIEQELGVRVLVRNARGLRLTSEGQALYVRVDTLLSQLNKAIAYVSACRDIPRGVLKVTSTTGLGRNRIAPLVSEFSRLYPDVTVQLSLGDRYVDMVLDDVDVAIAIGAPEDTSLVAKRLMSNPCCVCASPAYLKGRKAPRHPKDLKRHDCLILDCHGSFKDQWRLEDEYGGQHHVKVSGNLITDNSETLREWALKGYGVALKSRWDIVEHLDRGELVQLMPRYRAPDLDFYMVYAGRDLLPAKTRAFIDFLEENVERLKQPIKDPVKA